MDKNYNRWPKGVARNLNYPEIPVFQILRSSAMQWPERNAIIFAGMEITYRELDQLSDRFATALADLGVRKGDRVALHLPNSPQFAIAYYGLLKAGGVFVPVSPLLSERELAFQLKDAEVHTFIGLDLFYAAAKNVLPSTQTRNIILVSLADCYPPVSAPVKTLSKTVFEEGTHDFVTLLSSYPQEPPHLSIDVKKDLAHIPYTGGTTGTPKGIMVTHWNAVVNSCQLCFWFTGGNIRYEEGNLLDTMLQKFPGVVCEAYGLSEATAIVSISPTTREGFRLGSVGLPVADTEVKIFDPDNSTRELQVEEIGEICVRGPQVTRGFWKRPDETALMFQEDGWLLTGDVGKLDSDGYLYILDRKKDMLIYKGYNVYPRELEEVLNSHEAVVQSVIVGRQDDRYGDLPIAFVQIVSDASVTEEELLEYANSRLAAYKKIRALKIVEQIPISTAGKILRRELRGKVQEIEIEE